MAVMGLVGSLSCIRTDIRNGGDRATRFGYMSEDSQGTFCWSTNLGYTLLRMLGGHKYEV
jgi:hypothetical protein